MAKPSLQHAEEIYRTQAGVVYQCNRFNCFWLEFAGGISAFKIHDLLELKKRVEQINLEEMARNTSRGADVVIISLFRSERCFVLTLTDVLNLRELLQGAKVMLDLNSILHDCLHGMAV